MIGISIERMGGGSGTNTYMVWLTNVMPGGRQDYKLQPGGSEMIGNFNFGATGSIFHDPRTLLSAAGVVQLSTDPSSSDGGIPFITPPYGDESVDQDHIKAGIAGGVRMTTYLLHTSLIVATLMTLTACSVERTEVKRVVSPDNETAAVLVREHVAGAVGDMKFYVYLVKTGGEQELSRPNVVFDDCGGISPVWKDNTTLHLEYDPACYIRQFSNRWYEVTAVSIDQQRPPPVEIVLVRRSGKNSVHSRMGLKHTYSLCPIGAESRERLYVSVREFAEREGARLIDRGGEAQRELAGMRTGQAVLHSTGGGLIVLTVEKPGRFRVSVSNLGLIEKVALTIRYWNEAGHDAAVDTLLADIERFWIIQTVEGGVANDPPCVSPPDL